MLFWTLEFAGNRQIRSVWVNSIFYKLERHCWAFFLHCSIARVLNNDKWVYTINVTVSHMIF